MYAHLRARAYEQGTDVKGCAAFVGRDKTFVEFHNLFHHPAEQIRGNFGHQYAPAGALQAFGIVFHTEDAYFAVGTAECLLPFECFLPVVQAGGRHVNVYRFGGADFYFAPLAVAVVATHVIVGGHVAE